jgi:hypothetical protein
MYEPEKQKIWTKGDVSRLVTTEMRFLRSTEGKTKTDRIINEKSDR